MKFDKDIVTGIVISAVLLFAWQPICRMLGVAPEPVKQTQVQTVPVPAPVTPPVVTNNGEKSTPSNVATQAPGKAVARLPEQILENDDCELRISPTDGKITVLTLKNYRNFDRKNPVTLTQKIDDKCGILSISSPDKNTPWITVSVDTAKKDGKTFTLKRRVFCNQRTFEVTQVWTLANTGFVVNYNVTLRNLDAVALALPEFDICSGKLPTWQRLTGDVVRRPSHRLDFYTVAGKHEDIDGDAKEEKFFVPPVDVAWSAVSNKYCCLAFDSATPFRLLQVRELRGSGKEDYLIATGARIVDWNLAPGESRSLAFRLYAGPKINDNLSSFRPEVRKVMHLAWGPLDYLARLLLWILKGFFSITGSYGVSIILLTLLVRALFYPITAKGNASMRKMQEVQPKMKELRERYKDNPQLLNVKMMELYRAEGVNPFGGCLPILLQIPVFFALYETLERAVELRQVPFLWCTDLAAADTVARIPLYFFTLPINPLVIAMTALMLIQQRMTPMTGDVNQRRMMMAMPLVMLFFLYDLPSGLTLYWTISNFFSIIQMRLQQRANKAAASVGGSNKGK